VKLTPGLLALHEALSEEARTSDAPAWVEYRMLKALDEEMVREGYWTTWADELARWRAAQ
jgi:hypothetical protein